MKKFFKSIWNFFFKKKEDVGGSLLCGPRTKRAQQNAIKEMEKPKINSQLFRKHQLTDKIFNIGKHRYRIKQKIGFTESEKLRYQITQL